MDSVAGFTLLDLVAADENDLLQFLVGRLVDLRPLFVGLTQEPAGRLQALLPRRALVLLGQHPLQPPAVEQHVAELPAGRPGQDVPGLVGEELHQGFLRQLQGFVALGLGQARGRVDPGDGQFIVDGFREALRRAGIGPEMQKITDRLVVMALCTQFVERFFLRVRSRHLRRSRAEQNHGQQGEKHGLTRGEAIHPSKILRRVFGRMGLHFLADQRHELLERRLLPQPAVDLARRVQRPGTRRPACSASVAAEK